MKKSLIKLIYNPTLAIAITILTLFWIYPRMEQGLYAVTLAIAITIYAMKAISYYFEEN